MTIAMKNIGDKFITRKKGEELPRPNQLLTNQKLRIPPNGEKIDPPPSPINLRRKFPLVSIGGWAEGQACADLGAGLPSAPVELYQPHLWHLTSKVTNRMSENRKFICEIKTGNGKCPLSNQAVLSTFPFFGLELYINERNAHTKIPIFYWPTAKNAWKKYFFCFKSNQKIISGKNEFSIRRVKVFFLSIFGGWSIKYAKNVCAVWPKNMWI